MNAINTIRNKDKKKPSTEKIFKFVKKTDPDITIEFFKERLIQLEENGYVTCKGDGKEESYFILKPLESLSDVADVSNSNVDSSMTAEDNINFIQEMFDEISKKDIFPRAKSAASSNLSSGNEKLYEDMIAQLKSENLFLRDMLMNVRNDFLKKENEEILFLRKELEHKNKLLDQFILVSTSTQNPGAENTLISNKNIINSGNTSKTPGNCESVDKIKSKCVIIGDSIIKGLDEKEMKHTNYDIKVKSHPGATSEDLIDYIKPEVRKKPDNVIIHIGTNDLQNDLKTVDHIKQMCDYAKAKSPSTEIAVSLMTVRSDNNKLASSLKVMNDKIKKFAVKNKIKFIDHNNINESCLGSGKLHLNKKGKSALSRDFMNHLNRR